MFAQSAERSRFNLLWDDGEDDVLVASPHHRPQRVVPLYGGANVTGRGDSLAIDADDDITLLQASSVAKKVKVDRYHKKINIRCLQCGVDFNITLKGH